VDDQDAVQRHELAKPGHQVAKGVATLQPATRAELHPQRRAAGEGKGLAIGVRAADQARNASERHGGRVVRMESQTHAAALRGGDQALHQVGKVVPQFVLGISAPMRVWPAGHLSQVDVARPGPTARAARLGTPYLRGFPGERGHVDASLAKRLDKGHEICDDGIPAGERQVDLVGLAHRHVPDVVEAQSGVLDLVPQFGQEGDVTLRVIHPGVDAIHTELASKEQFVLLRRGRDVHGQTQCGPVYLARHSVPLLTAEREPAGRRHSRPWPAYGCGAALLAGYRARDRRAARILRSGCPTG